MHKIPANIIISDAIIKYTFQEEKSFLDQRTAHVRPANMIAVSASACRMIYPKPIVYSIEQTYPMLLEMHSVRTRRKMQFSGNLLLAPNWRINRLPIVGMTIKRGIPHEL